jgi:hypothetical protein
VKDRRAPLHWTLLVLPLVLLTVILGTRAPAVAQAQFQPMIGVVGNT